MKKVMVLSSVLLMVVFMMSCHSNSQVNNVYESQINEEGLYTGFDDLPESLTLEEALLGQDYILRRSEPYANQVLWDDFYEQSTKGQACQIRIINFQDNKENHPDYSDIYYHEGLYFIYDSSDQNQTGHQYKYLLTLENDKNTTQIHMRQFVLADQADLTFEAYEKSLLSSLSTAFDDIGPVYLLMFEKLSETTLINLSYKELALTLHSDEELKTFTGAVEKNYTALENIYPSRVKTIQCDYEFDYEAPPIVVRHPQGYLMGGLITMDSSPKKQPLVILMDESGEIIWKEIYDNPLSTGYMSNLTVYDDGRFLFTLSNWPESSMGSPKNLPSKLIQCNSKGQVNFIKEFEDLIGSALKFVFLTEDEAIIVAGESSEIVIKSSVQSKVNSDIQFIKLNSQGQEIARRQYGGMSNEYLENCKYLPERGLVFTGWSNSKAGEFARETVDENWQDYVAFINEDIELEWVNHPEGDERFSYDQLEVNHQGIFLMGNTLLKKEPQGYLEHKELFIVNYDFTGQVAYKTYCSEHEGFQGVMSVDSNSNLVVGSGDSNQGILSFYDKYGKKTSDFIAVSYPPTEITSTATGGFLVKAIRAISLIPQPAYVSSLWFDHDLIIEEYDQDKGLMWRKVFNDYEDQRIDFVEVFDH